MAVVSDTGRKGFASIGSSSLVKGTTTNVSQTGAMFDKNGKPIGGGGSEKRFVRPTQVGGGASQAGAILNSIKGTVQKEEKEMGGLVSLTKNGFAGRGVGGSAGVVQIGKPAATIQGGLNTAPESNATQLGRNSLIKSGAKVIPIGGNGTVGGSTVSAPQVNVGGVSVVSGTAVTADQKIATAKRNAGKLLNRILEMSYTLTEQEEKYLIELMDAIGMKESLMSAAGHGTATPINTQVILNAINEMNQVMVSNTTMISSNVEVANSLYSKLDNLTVEAQAGGYNESELISVLAELYANNMINVNDTSKPNLIFCFNTFKSQIERMVGVVNPAQHNTNTRIGNVGGALVVPLQNNNSISGGTTTTVGVNAGSNTGGGKLFVKPQHSLAGGFTRTLSGGVMRSGNSLATRVSGNTGMITGVTGSNSLRSPIVSGGVTANVSARGVIGNQSLNSEPNYSSRVDQNVRGGALAGGINRVTTGAGVGGVSPRGTITQVNAVQQASNPITAYMNM